MSRSRFHWLTGSLPGVALVAALTSGPSAYAAEGNEFRASLGTRAWFARWTSWFPTDSGGDGANDLIQTETADQKLAIIPSVSATYGKFFGSLSALPQTSFDFTLANSGTRVTAQRRELDTNVGY